LIFRGPNMVWREKRRRKRKNIHRLFERLVQVEFGFLGLFFKCFFYHLIFGWLRIELCDFFHFSLFELFWSRVFFFVVFFFKKNYYFFAYLLFNIMLVWELYLIVFFFNLLSTWVIMISWLDGWFGMLTRVDSGRFLFFFKLILFLIFDLLGIEFHFFFYWGYLILF